MFIREENIEQYLTEQYTTSFDLAYLKSDLENAPILQAYTIIYVWCYQSSDHNFLVLQLTCQTSPEKKDIWMRLERVPRFPRATTSFPQHFPANDVYSMNYDYEAVIKGEMNGLQAVAALGQLSGLSLSHVVELASIIRDVSGEWETPDANSRWFCVIILRALGGRFGGVQMLGSAGDAFLDNLGKEGRPAQIVWDRFIPKDQSACETGPVLEGNHSESGLGYCSNLKRKLGLPRETNKSESTAAVALGNNLTDTVWKSSFAPEIQRGTISLKNLGNTCYMNAALQCLIHIPEIEEYFLSGLYRYELNLVNELGMLGQMANAFAILMNHVYPSPHSFSIKHLTGSDGWTNPVNSYVYAPKVLKKTIEWFAPSFSGDQQHDAQEFLAVLLAGLHEDLNRSNKQPYVETLEWPEEEISEREAAQEIWKDYKKHNDSVIVDLFQGMYKSTLTCPECQEDSITFDPFMYLTLPLPFTTPWRHIVYYVPWDLRKPTLEVELIVPKGSNYGYLKQLFSRWFGVDAGNLLVAEVWSHKFYKFYEDYMDFTELAEKDTLVVYELPVPLGSIAKTPLSPSRTRLNFMSESTPVEPDPNAPFLVPVFHLSEQKNSWFGVPSFVLLTPAEASTREGIFRAVVERCGRWTRNKREMSKWYGRKELISLEDLEGGDTDGEPAPFELKIFSSTTATGLETGFHINLSTVQWVDWGTRDCPMQPNPAFSGRTSDGGTPAIINQASIPIPLIRSTDALVCRWSVTKQSYFFGDNASLFDEWKKYVHPEIQALRGLTAVTLSGKPHLDIEDCLDEFTKEERLGQSDLWYCFQCEKDQQGAKKLELWSVPDIFLIQLNRFAIEQSNSHKIEMFVNFPTKRLDLGSRVKGGGATNSNENKYDLFAVGEHTGTLEMGHYQAYIRNMSDDQWYCFDDEYMTKCNAEDAVNNNAYLLFYRRCTLV